MGRRTFIKLIGAALSSGGKAAKLLEQAPRLSLDKLLEYLRVGNFFKLSAQAATSSILERLDAALFFSLPTMRRSDHGVTFTPPEYSFQQDDDRFNVGLYYRDIFRQGHTVDGVHMGWSQGIFDSWCKSHFEPVTTHKNGHTLYSYNKTGANALAAMADKFVADRSNLFGGANIFSVLLNNSEALKAISAYVTSSFGRFSPERYITDPETGGWKSIQSKMLMGKIVLYGDRCHNYAEGNHTTAFTLQYEIDLEGPARELRLMDDFRRIYRQEDLVHNSRFQKILGADPELHQFIHDHDGWLRAQTKKITDLAGKPDQQVRTDVGHFLKSCQETRANIEAGEKILLQRYAAQRQLMIEADRLTSIEVGERYRIADIKREAERAVEMDNLFDGLSVSRRQATGKPFTTNAAGYNIFVPRNTETREISEGGKVVGKISIPRESHQEWRARTKEKAHEITGKLQRTYLRSQSFHNGRAILCLTYNCGHDEKVLDRKCAESPAIAQQRS